MGVVDVFFNLFGWLLSLPILRNGEVGVKQTCRVVDGKYG